MNPDDDYEVVERRILGRTWPVEQVAETAVTGKAVRISMNGRSRSSFRVAISKAMAIRGLKGHLSMEPDGTHALIWATKE